jgi:2-(1,2-epoxy-1,2-dihydrophenyl)acetyl-CoA isomerase
MTESSTVTLDVSGAVATVTLNRPDALNALNLALRVDLFNALTYVNDHKDVRFVIISGAGRGFCAGADLSEVHPADQTVEQRLNEQYKPILVGVEESSKIWIAAVQGTAAGIGASLALCCDLVVMEESACLYQAFSAVGLIPDGGLSVLMQRQLGKKKALEVLALGQRLNAETCLALGLINRIADTGEALASANDFARELLGRAPLSVRYTKEILRQVEQKDLGDAISLEARMQLQLSQSEDHREGRRAFMEKRPAEWKGR